MGKRWDRQRGTKSQLDLRDLLKHWSEVKMSGFRLFVTLYLKLS